MNTKKFIFCNNCGKLGHLFHQCKVPITSIGIIPIRITKKVNPKCFGLYVGAPPRCLRQNTHLKDKFTELEIQEIIDEFEKIKL